MKKLPVARSGGIVVQPLGRELLVYDMSIHKAYNLNETSAAVYQACDGAKTFEDLKRAHRFTDELIHLTLDQLRDENLLDGDERRISPFGEMSRRDAIRRVGLAALVALPVISSLAAPTAAHAQSLTQLVCTTGTGQVCAVFTDCNAYCSTAFNSSCTCVLNCCVECPNPNITCNNACINPQTDNNNCGGCGNVCVNNTVCINSVCTPTF